MKTDVEDPSVQDQANKNMNTKKYHQKQKSKLECTIMTVCDF